MVSVAIIVIAVVASAFMAWSIGAGSSGSTPFAPAVGANAISVMRAGFVVGVLGLLGAVLQGASVSGAIGHELVRGVSLSPVAAIVGLSTAAVLVSIGVFWGYPIATAFTVTGAVVGVGLALGGAPAWAKYREIVALWVLVPFVGGAVAYATARFLDDDRVPEWVAIPLLGALVGLVIANAPFALLGPPGSSASIATAFATWLSRAYAAPTLAGKAASDLLVAGGIALVFLQEVRRDGVTGERRFLLALGALVAFSAGGSQVGLAVGPLLPLRADVHLPLLAILVGGGVGLLAGSWTGAPRMIKALSQDYSSLSTNRSIAALVPSFVIAQSAVLFGVPVSFNEVIVSAIVGAGYAGGSAGISRQKIGYTVLAWVGSLALAGLVSYGAFTLVSSYV